MSKRNLMGKKIDLDKIIEDFDDFDFGFTSISEEEYNSSLKKSELTVEQYKQRLTDVEKIIMPFLVKLLKTSDKSHIYWPNRKEILESTIEKIIKLTREE